MAELSGYIAKKLAWVSSVLIEFLKSGMESGFPVE